MGKFVKGDIVVIPFPFTDLSDAKKRPAFVVADLPGEVYVNGAWYSNWSYQRKTSARHHCVAGTVLAGGLTNEK